MKETLFSLSNCIAVANVRNHKIVTVVLSVQKIFLPEDDAISVETCRRKDDNEPFTAYWLHDAPTGLILENFTLCPQCIYVFCIYMRTNSDLCHLHHKLIGFYNRDEKCLQRGTDWVFK